MEVYKKRLADLLAETGALFFDKGLILKDGRPTPYFVNLGMFRTGRLGMEMGSFFADMMIERNLVDHVDILLGPSYKGSAIALASAIALYVNHGYDLLFEYDRKEPKTHGEGSRFVSQFVNTTFFDRCRVFIIDDVATSMGTKYDLLHKIQGEANTLKVDIRVTGIGIAIDREQTSAVYDEKGQVKLGEKGVNATETFVKRTGIPVYTVAGISEVVEYLYSESIPVLIEGKRQLIDEETKLHFDDYLRTYGFHS